MRLRLKFRVNGARITDSDLHWLRRFQRELVAAVASLAYMEVAAAEDSLLAEYLRRGEIWEGVKAFAPPEEILRGDKRKEARRSMSFGVVQTARHMFWFGDLHGWNANRWPVLVHMVLLALHTFTRSWLEGDQLKVETRIALPAGVNEHCEALCRRVIWRMWFRAEIDPPVDPYFPGYPLLRAARSALELDCASGEVRQRLEESLAFLAERLDPILGRQDPDLGYTGSDGDQEMFVRLTGAEVDPDNGVPVSDVDIPWEQW